MRLINADKLCAILTDWQLCEMPEENVNYKSGRMVTDHERQYEVYLILEEVIKEVTDQEYVKAIPVEWISAKVKQRLEHKSYQSASNFQWVIDLWNVEKEDWGKENEID